MSDLLTDRMFWTDIETTGLEPDTCEILEVGFAITSPWGDIIDCDNWIIRTRGPVDMTYMPDVVREMHTKSGLLDEVASLKALYKDEVELLVWDWLNKHNIEPKAYPLCGSSVHFDRSFFVNYMPIVNKLFHYRNIDVSSNNELMRLHRPDLYAERPVAQEKHRVLPDLEDTIEAYRYQLRYFLQTDLREKNDRARSGGLGRQELIPPPPPLQDNKSLGEYEDRR